MKKQILSAKQAVEKAKSVMLDNYKEHLIGLYLNTKCNVIKIELIGLGTVDACLVHPREVFRPAIVGRATSVILLHNHPSGNVEAGDDDINITKRIKRAGEILGIILHDHIIFSGNKHNSIINL